VNVLVSLKLDQNRDLWRCPSCNALFYYDSYVAQTGSGNNDEDTLERLEKPVADLVDSLFALTADPTDGPRVLREAFERVPEGIIDMMVTHLLHGLAPAAFDPLVPQLVDRLIRTDDWWLAGVVEAHGSRDRGRMERLRRMFAEDPRPKGGRTRYVLDKWAKSLGPQA